MEALKFIPQLFFDILGRVVPGYLAILLGIIVYYQTGYGFSLKEIFDVSLGLTLFIAFIIGHLVSPLTKIIQGWNQENLDPLKGVRKVVFKIIVIFFKTEIENYTKTHITPLQEPGNSSKESENVKPSQPDIKTNNLSDKDIKSKKYNWLRLKEPDAGGLCAKLRAEFTMYNSFAAVFLIYSVVEVVIFIRLIVFYQEFSTMAGGLIIGYLLLFIAMSNRGQEGEDTFSKGVKIFYELAEAPLID